MSESDIDPEDDLLIRGRPRSAEEDEWDDADEGHLSELDRPPGKAEARDTDIATGVPAH